MRDLCKSCYVTSETAIVQVRRGERGTPWEDSTVNRCANNECWAIIEGTDADKLSWIGNVYDYKYFGDYPLSEEQLSAVYEALGMAKKSCALEEENKRLREALEPFAKAADIKLCGDWRDDERFAQTDVGHYLTFGHLRAARAALENKS
jgi:hypothetical protein